MALAEKAAPSQSSRRRLWKKPQTRAKWYWLIFSIVLYGGVSIWYYSALKTNPYPYPAAAPFWIFGIIAFSLVILVASYSLRRRFIRVLPGRVEDWLWLHTWLGVVSILIAFQHEAYLDFFNNFRFTFYDLTRAGLGVTALYGLILLVVSGGIGRILDVWQARVISHEVSKNGVGIIQSVEERLQKQDLLFERLSAGKSAAFKEVCAQALKRSGVPPLPSQEQFAPQELEDLQRFYRELALRFRLRRSLQRLCHAQLVIRGWRVIHISLACVALLFISIHSIFEMAKMLLQFLLHH
jgi:hypothetical protein